MAERGGKPTYQAGGEACPGLPLPGARGRRLPITYINSGAQPGPICRLPPHLGSPRQTPRARWWLGGVTVRGGPRSPSLHLTPPPTHALNLLFLSSSTPPHTHPSPPPQVKKSDHARQRQQVGSIPSPPQPLLGPRRVPAPPAAILSPRRQRSLFRRADS